MEKRKEKIKGVLDGIYRGFSLIYAMPTAYRKGLHNIIHDTEFSKDKKTTLSLYTTTAVTSLGFIFYAYATINGIQKFYSLPLATNLTSLFYELVAKPKNKGGKNLQDLMKDNFKRIKENFRSLLRRY